MGPHSFECGNPPTSRPASSISWRFNGAALVRVRKCSFRSPSPLTGTLQWGRTRSSAEISNRFDSGTVAGTRFNGAALVRVRKPIWADRVRPLAQLLQWGRTRSSAEIYYPRRWGVIRRCASMGPHSFECGNLGRARVAQRPGGPASMGPHSFECGNPGRPQPALCAESASMGPHSFECGNVKLSRQCHRPKRASMGPHSFECGNLRWNRA